MALFYMRGVPIGIVAIMLALLASMGGFIFGYDTGQISDILLMRDFLFRFATCQPGATVETATEMCAFNVWRSGLIVSLLSIGTLFGALFGAPTADWLGRRYAMVAECILFIIGVIIQITATDVWQQFAVGRLVSGLAVGALSAAVPMYQAETAPSQIRGTLTATYQLFITFGILVACTYSLHSTFRPSRQLAFVRLHIHRNSKHQRCRIMANRSRSRNYLAFYTRNRYLVHARVSSLVGYQR